MFRKKEFYCKCQNLSVGKPFLFYFFYQILKVHQLANARHDQQVHELYLYETSFVVFNHLNTNGSIQQHWVIFFLTSQKLNDIIYPANMSYFFKNKQT